MGPEGGLAELEVNGSGAAPLVGIAPNGKFAVVAMIYGGIEYTEAGKKRQGLRKVGRIRYAAARQVSCRAESRLERFQLARREGACDWGFTRSAGKLKSTSEQNCRTAAARQCAAWSRKGNGCVVVGGCSKGVYGHARGVNKQAGSPLWR